MRVTTTISPEARALTIRSNSRRSGPRAARLLAVDFGATLGTQLFKLRVERLAVGADASIPEASVFEFNFGHMFRKT